MVRKIRSSQFFDGEEATSWVFTTDGEQLAVGVSNDHSNTRIFNEVTADTGYTLEAEIRRDELELFGPGLRPGADDGARYFRFRPQALSR